MIEFNQHYMKALKSAYNMIVVKTEDEHTFFCVLQYLEPHFLCMLPVSQLIELSSASQVDDSQVGNSYKCHVQFEKVPAS